MNYYIEVWKKFAQFDGRARRSEYWYFVLFNTIASFVLAMIGSQVAVLGILYTIYVLAALVPSLAVAVRRMHDVGKSGWYILIPIYNLILALTEGEKGRNQYGPDPKGGPEEMAIEDHLVS